VLLSLLDDPLAEQREIYRLDDWLSESGLTGIITAKSQGDDPFVAEGYGFMQFMADCVVALKLRVVDQIALRYVQVMKIRPKSCATFPRWAFALAAFEERRVEDAFGAH
jgi:circadian clock protein KaiC